MNWNQLSRLSGLAAIGSALLTFLAAGAIVVSIFVPVIPEIALLGIDLVADILIIFALLGIYGVQMKESGTLGLAGFVLAIAGFLLPAPLEWVVYMMGLFLLAVASTRTGRLPALGMWLWFLGAAIAILMGLAGFRILTAFGLTMAGCGRIWLGVALSSVRAPSPLSNSSILSILGSGE